MQVKLPDGSSQIMPWPIPDYVNYQGEYRKVARTLFDSGVIRIEFEREANQDVINHGKKATAKKPKHKHVRKK